MSIELIALDRRDWERVAADPTAFVCERKLTLGSAPELLQSVGRQTVALFDRTGVTGPPWGCFLAADRAAEVVVGTCGFTGPPDSEGVVEIAYFTFPSFEGQGVASAMATALVERAQSAGARRIRAHTLPERNASTRILEKVGFARAGEVSDPEAGPVWRWERDPLPGEPPEPRSAPIRTAALTLSALIAFASNSLLTRLALGPRLIDAASFTAVRLVAGAIVLALLVRAQAGAWAPLKGSGGRGTMGALALFVYAAPFSFAYLRIGAAVGALVLFGVVQLTMVGYALFRGERPSLLTWVGLLLATTGLVTLTAPSATRPDPLGLALMAVAGVAWGVYTLVGRTTAGPLVANARSFLWASPLALALVLFSVGSVSASARGVALALVSGGVTSGLGYAVWYRALPRLSVPQAAVAQLSVPILAALGAVVLLDEKLGARLVLSGASVLGGIALVLAARSRASHG